MFRLDGRSALVVGAGGGIGRAVAEALTDAGARVRCADVDGVAAKETADAIGADATSLTLDVNDPQATAAAMSDELPDVVVTTVGVNVRKLIEDYTDQDAQRVFGTNVIGTFNVLRACGPAMAKRGSGSFIAFSSVRSLTVEPGQGLYAASKAGLIQLVRTAAAEYGPAGVRCNVVAPGVVETPLTRQIRDQPEWYDAYANKTALRRWAQPSEIAGAVVFLASEAASYVTGAVMYIDGGWTAVDGRFDPPT